MVNLSQVVFTTLVATINLVQALMLNGSSVTKVNVITTTTGTITKTSEVVVPAEPTPTSPAVVSTPIAVGLPPVITGLSQIAKVWSVFRVGHSYQYANLCHFSSSRTISAFPALVWPSILIWTSTGKACRSPEPISPMTIHSGMLVSSRTAPQTTHPSPQRTTSPSSKEHRR